MSRQSDAERLERLARTHGPRVVRYLHRRTRDAEDAADTFQATMTIAWRKISSVPTDDDRALAWLLAAARRCAANQRRRNRRRLAATERLAGEIRTSAVDAAETPDDTVRRAVAGLPSDQREVIELVYWDDLSCEQAAEVMGIGAAACRKRLQRGRDALRTLLSAPEAARCAGPVTRSGAGTTTAG